MTSDPAPADKLIADLRARLWAAGVTDWAGFNAAMERNPRLRTQFANVTAAQIQADSMAAFEAFSEIVDSQALLTLTQQKPVVLTDGFIAGIEAVIARAEAAGYADTAEGLHWRLADLRRIRAELPEPPEPPLLPRALMTFLEAKDEAEARAVFAWAWVLLQSDEAQRILDEQFRDPEDRSDTTHEKHHLAERRALLRRLRAADLSKLNPG